MFDNFNFIVLSTGIFVLVVLTLVVRISLTNKPFVYKDRWYFIPAIWYMSFLFLTSALKVVNSPKNSVWIFLLVMFCFNLGLFYMIYKKLKNKFSFIGADSNSFAQKLTQYLEMNHYDYQTNSDKIQIKKNDLEIQVSYHNFTNNPSLQMLSSTGTEELKQIVQDLDNSGIKANPQSVLWPTLFFGGLIFGLWYWAIL